jgi:hypothetical protein
MFQCTAIVGGVFAYCTSDGRELSTKQFENSVNRPEDDARAQGDE